MSYLTVGLLFGLTLPGVSAHGFLGGRGRRRRGNRVILLYRKTMSAVLTEKGETERDREERKKTRRERRESRGSSDRCSRGQDSVDPDR